MNALSSVQNWIPSQLFLPVDLFVFAVAAFVDNFEFVVVIMSPPFFFSLPSL